MYFGTFDMSIHENMLSRPSNHFCQPTHSGGPPQSRAMAPMSTLSMSTITRPATKQNSGYQMHHFIYTIFLLILGYDQRYDFSIKKGGSNPNQNLINGHSKIGRTAKPWDLWRLSPLQLQKRPHHDSLRSYLGGRWYPCDRPPGRRKETGQLGPRSTASHPTLEQSLKRCIYMIGHRLTSPKRDL